MGKTIEEIAAELGVSITTVRLVLLGKARQYRVSRDTEARVKHYTEEHGYQINHTARSLRLQRTDSLALIVPRLSNHFFASIAEQLEIRCRQARLQLFISCCYDNPDTQLELIKSFRQRNIDGLFVVPANSKIPPYAAQLFNQRMVLLDRDFGFQEYPVVIADNATGSYTLARRLHDYLTQRGHATPRGNETYGGAIDSETTFDETTFEEAIFKETTFEETTFEETRFKETIFEETSFEETRFLLIVGNSEMPSIAARVRGFKQALADLNFPAENIWISNVPRNDFAEGMAAMTEFLNSIFALPSTLVTSSIPLFEGALHALRHIYGSVPEAMVLATFDDHTMLDFLPNPLCSVRQDSIHMVNAAFAEMEKLIAGIKQPERHIAAMNLVCRNMPTVAE